MLSDTARLPYWRSRAAHVRFCVLDAGENFREEFLAAVTEKFVPGHKDCRWEKDPDLSDYVYDSERVEVLEKIIDCLALAATYVCRFVAMWFTLVVVDRNWTSSLASNEFEHGPHFAQKSATEGATL